MVFDELTINAIFTSDFNIFTFPFDQTKKIFKTYKAFKEFILTEAEFWKPYDYGSFRRFSEVFRSISSILAQLENESSENAKMHFSNIHNQTKNAHFISSDHPLSQFLVKEYKDNKDKAVAAYTYLIDENYSPNWGRKVQFEGILNAYSFKYQDECMASKEYVSNRITEYAARFAEEITKMNEEYLVLETKYKTILERSEQLLVRTTEKFDNQAKKQLEDFDNEMLSCNQKRSELENTYQELLRLKKPAEYWNMLKAEYSKDGQNWVYASISAGTVLSTLLLLIFYNFPAWLKGGFSPDHLKGFILFALIVSVFTYLIHLFIKLANSSFHLSKDANERLQLTHVYLALLNEKAIEAGEREIILQALFSRADTGLLKNDGGPTMPGVNNILEIMTKLKR